MVQMYRGPPGRGGDQSHRTGNFIVGVAVVATNSNGRARIRTAAYRLSRSLVGRAAAPPPASSYDVTRTSTVMLSKASDIPEKLPVTGIVWRMSRATATGIRLAPPTLRFVGSKVIQPAPGT